MAALSWQGCSATEGLCGNVFRDGDLTGASEGSTQESSGGEGRGRKKDGTLPAGGETPAEGSQETPARFLLTG